MPSNQLFTDWVSGDLITASKLNQMKNDLAILAGPSFVGSVSITVNNGRVFYNRPSGAVNVYQGLEFQDNGSVRAYWLYDYNQNRMVLLDSGAVEKFSIDRSSGQPRVGSNPVWHAGNDGKGSGLHTDIISARAVRVYKTSSQSILNNTDTTLSWDAEAYDTDDFHDNVTNNSRLVAPRTGKYLITANIQWAVGGANTSRVVRFKINGAIDANIDVDYANSNGNSVYQSPSTVVLLNSGDYVEVVVNQNSGATSAVFGQTNQDTSFTLTYLGD